MKRAPHEYAPWSLIDAYQRGDNAAGAELLRRNDGMIKKTAYGHLHFAPKLDLDDLLQQARVGLLVGFEKCRREKCRGASPASYALLWARAHVQQFAADHGRDVRLPRRPQFEKKRRGKIVPWAALTGLSLEAEVARAPNGERQTILDVLAGPDNSDELREQNLFSIVVAELLGMLACKPRDILCRHFGLFGYDEQTLEEIARAYGVSRQRINQIEIRAMASLREQARARGYLYIDDLPEVA